MLIYCEESSAGGLPPQSADVRCTGCSSSISSRPLLRPKKVLLLVLVLVAQYFILCSEFKYSRGLFTCLHHSAATVTIPIANTTTKALPSKDDLVVDELSSWPSTSYNGNAEASASEEHFQCPGTSFVKADRIALRKKLFRGHTNDTDFTRESAERISTDRALLMHMGKAGGGTIKATIMKHWGYKMQECHGSAKHCFNDPEEGYVDGWDERLLFLTIRDPIERFVSAFNWDVKQTCQTTNETRTKVTGGNLSVLYPDKYCKVKDHYNPRRRPTGPMFQSSAEKMAQDLCKDDPGTGDLAVNTDSTAYKVMSRRLPHVRGCTLSSYLGEEFPDTYNWKDNTDRLIPVVMEKGYDLVAASKYSILYASKIRNITTNVFYEDLTFPARRTLAMCSGEEKNQKSKPTEQADSPTLHTSALSKDGREKYLSERSKKCLAKFYQRDYEILSEMLELDVCKSEECRLAIQSILKRRQDVLPIR